jgi:hypothetical protein
MWLGEMTRPIFSGVRVTRSLVLCVCHISWSFFCSVISIERWLFFFDDIDEIAGLPGAVVVIIVW